MAIFSEDTLDVLAEVHEVHTGALKEHIDGLGDVNDVTISSDVVHWSNGSGMFGDGTLMETWTSLGQMTAVKRVNREVYQFQHILISTQPL